MDANLLLHSGFGSIHQDGNLEVDFHLLGEVLRLRACLAHAAGDRLPDEAHLAVRQVMLLRELEVGNVEGATIAFTSGMSSRKKMRPPSPRAGAGR